VGKGLAMDWNQYFIKITMLCLGGRITEYLADQLLARWLDHNDLNEDCACIPSWRNEPIQRTETGY
jgi:hypothetical protein